MAAVGWFARGAGLSEAGLQEGWKEALPLRSGPREAAWSWEMASLTWGGGGEGRLLWAGQLLCVFSTVGKMFGESGLGGKRMHCNYCLKEKITILMMKKNMPSSHTMSHP